MPVNSLILYFLLFLTTGKRGLVFLILEFCFVKSSPNNRARLLHCVTPKVTKQNSRIRGYFSLFSSERKVQYVSELIHIVAISAIHAPHLENKIHRFSDYMHDLTPMILVTEDFYLNNKITGNYVQAKRKAFEDFCGSFLKK